MDADRQILEHLEPQLLVAPPDEAAAMVALIAAEQVALDPDDVAAAIRRALLVLAAGGDLQRDLAFDEPAVVALAADLDEPERRRALGEALSALRGRTDGLPGAAAALDGLLGDPERAWRGLAAALLADELTD